MEVLKLVIADKDEEFINRFNQYIRFFDIKKVMIHKSFNDFDLFQQYLNACEEYVVILVNEEWSKRSVSCDCHDDHKNETMQSCSTWVTQHVRPGKLRRIITISERQGELGCHHLPIVHKYQPLHELIESLQELCTLEQVSPRKRMIQHTCIISFYAAVGGCGKTTAAINAAKQLTERKQRTLFVSLEACSTLSSLIDLTASHRFDKLLYDLKHKHEEHIIQELDKYINYDDRLGFDCLVPMNDVHNSLDIEMANISLLLRLLQQSRDYDVIIIDLDGAVSPTSCAALAASDVIIWLMLDDATGIHRMQRLLQEHPHIAALPYDQWQQSVVFVMNKYLGQLHNELLYTDDVRVAHYLPYIPQWKGIASMTDWFQSPVFNQSIATLLDDVLNESSQPVAREAV